MNIKKIGNIVYDDDLVGQDEQFEFINYIDKISKLPSIDNFLPTLYIGWELIKTINNLPKLNILNKEVIPNKIYWEFSYNENKSSHIEGVEFFIKNLPVYYFTSRYSFTNLDPLFFNIENEQDLYDIIPRKIDNYYIYKNNYLYVLKYNKITLIDLKSYHFFHFSIKNIKNYIKEKSKRGYIDNDGDLLIEYKKKYNDYEQLLRYMVVLI